MCLSACPYKTLWNMNCYTKVSKQDWSILNLAKTGAAKLLPLAIKTIAILIVSTKHNKANLQFRKRKWYLTILWGNFKQTFVLVPQKVWGQKFKKVTKFKRFWLIWHRHIAYTNVLTCLSPVCVKLTKKLKEKWVSKAVSNHWVYTNTQQSPLNRILPLDKLILSKCKNIYCSSQIYQFKGTFLVSQLIVEYVIATLINEVRMPPLSLFSKVRKVDKVNPGVRRSLHEICFFKFKISERRTDKKS